jgi:hypothetical protein
MLSNLQQYFRNRESPPLWLGLCLLALLLGATLVLCESVGGVRSDMELYYKYSLQIVQGKFPYRDFPLEYPPLSLLPLLLPQLLNFVTSYSYLGYVILFSAQNILIAWAIGNLILKIAEIQKLPRKVSQILMIYAFLLVVNLPLVLWRYDMFCALLTLWALWLALTDRPLLAGVALGLGVATKLYPVVFVPFLVIYCCAQKQYKSALRLILGSAITPLLVLLFLSPLGLSNLLGFLSYHRLRGLQVEALSSGVLLLLQKLGGVSVNIVLNYGAFHLESPSAALILQGLSIISLVGFTAILLSYVNCCRPQREAGRSLDTRYLIIHILAGLLLLMVASKVFSPQYLIWLLPFISLVPTPKIALFSLISVLSFLIYPVMYTSLLSQTWIPILTLNLRNGLTLLLMLWLMKLPSYGLKRKALVQRHD